jgi:polyphenol oxidase
MKISSADSVKTNAMFLRSATLANCSGIKHGFFTRAGGVSNGVYASLNGGVGSKDDPTLVAANRARMAAALDCKPDRLITALQIHSPTVVVAETPWSTADRPPADAIVTRQPGLAIGVSTADCGPILFADAEARVIGAAHAGWRGALGGVIEAAIAAMEKLGAKRTRIAAALGPMIRKDNYEVGDDLVVKFCAAGAQNEVFFSAAGRAGHAMFDLAGYIGGRLRAAGVAHDDLGLCTYADPDRFYSYRRMTHRGEADYGRHINAIVLAP